MKRIIVLSPLLLVSCLANREQIRLAERNQLKKEILAEIRAEMGRHGTTGAGEAPIPAGQGSSGNAPSASGAGPAAAPSIATPSTGVNVGAVEGRLLRSSSGMADARVRIVRMEAFDSKLSADYRADEYYDARTDTQGQFRFSAVEPGKYKLLWVPQGADYWVRFMADKPDAMVKQGQTASIRPIETQRKLAGE